MYEFYCTINSVYDGDTVTATIQLGFDVALKMPLRLLGIDCPELKTGEFKAQGKAAKEWLIAKVKDQKLVIRTHKCHGNGAKDKYGRILAEMFVVGEAVSINQQLIDAGHAIAYDGGTNDPTAFGTMHRN
jgi:micrococcal nuclease